MSVKEQYRKYSLITIILGLGLLLFLKMTPFMGGILGACTIYIMVRDQMLYLTQKKKIRKSVTAIILLIEAILCFLVPLSLAVWLLISKLQTVNVDTATFVDTITNLADWIRRKTEYDLLSKENISSIASILPGIGQFLMGGISSFAVNLFVLVFVLYFMLIGGTKMEQYIYELLPFSDSNKKHVMNEINMIVRAVSHYWQSFKEQSLRWDITCLMLPVHCSSVSLPALPPSFLLWEQPLYGFP